MRSKVTVGWSHPIIVLHMLSTKINIGTIGKSYPHQMYTHLCPYSSFQRRMSGQEPCNLAPSTKTEYALFWRSRFGLGESVLGSPTLSSKFLVCVDMGLVVFSLSSISHSPSPTQQSFCISVLNKMYENSMLLFLIQRHLHDDAPPRWNEGLRGAIHFYRVI